MNIGKYQEFRIEVVLPNGTKRDQFAGIGPVNFETTLEFARKVARIHNAQVYVRIRSNDQRDQRVTSEENDSVVGRKRHQ